MSLAATLAMVALGASIAGVGAFFACVRAIDRNGGGFGWEFVCQVCVIVSCICGGNAIGALLWPAAWGA